MLAVCDNTGGTRSILKEWKGDDNVMRVISFSVSWNIGGSSPHQFCFVLHCVLCFAVGILGWADHLHCGKIPERSRLQLTGGAVLASVGAVGIVGQLITGGSLRPLHWLRFVALEYWSGHRDPAPALFLVLQCILVQQTPESSML